MSVAKTGFQSSESNPPTFRGFSEDSLIIQALIEKTQDHLNFPVLNNAEILGFMEGGAEFISSSVPATNLRETLTNLKLLFQDCSQENWDGYGASALKKKAFEEAEKFLSQLPAGIPAPEAAPQPDGDIALEWELETDRWFIASFPGEGRIDYAGAFGSEARSKGVEQFLQTIPDEILKKLFRLFSIEA